MLFAFSEEKKERKNKHIRQTLDSDDKGKLGFEKKDKLFPLFVCLLTSGGRSVLTQFVFSSLVIRSMMARRRALSLLAVPVPALSFIFG